MAKHNFIYVVTGLYLWLSRCCACIAMCCSVLNNQLMQLTCSRQKLALSEVHVPIVLTMLKILLKIILHNKLISKRLGGCLFYQSNFTMSGNR